MENYIIDSSETAKDFIAYVKEMPTLVPKVKGNVVEFNGDCFEIEQKYNYIIKEFGNEFEEQRENLDCDVDFEIPNEVTSDIDKLLKTKMRKAVNVISSFNLDKIKAVAQEVLDWQNDRIGHSFGNISLHHSDEGHGRWKPMDSYLDVSRKMFGFKHDLERGINGGTRTIIPFILSDGKKSPRGTEVNTSEVSTKIIYR